MSKKGRCISKVMGVKIDITQQDRVLENISSWVVSRGKKMVVTPNPEMVMLAQDDAGSMKALNKADLSIPDGWGLRLVDKRLKSRVTGYETMIKLVELASEKGWRVFMFGGRDKVAERCAEKLRDRYPELQIKGFSGPRSLSEASELEKKEVVDRINSFKPQLLFVGLGQVKQEKWIVKNLDKLRVKVAMGVGGSFDQVVRPWLKAPEFMQRIGLGWFWRLLVQPWRVKRQMKLVEFVIRAKREKE